MLTPKDKGKEVKMVLINSHRVRGTVVDVDGDSALIRTELTDFRVLFSQISTVTRVGDFSS
jgi:ribosome maturation factor RimP